VDSEDVVKDILRYRSFISSGGVTLSGGEPLLQPEFAAAILQGCKANGLHTAIDTAGGVPLSLCKEAVDAADLLLLDIKAADPELFLQITGRPIDHTLALLRYCEETHKPVWIRHVLVPDLTLTEPLLRRLGELLQPFSCIERAELLPFHKMGEFKWREMDCAYQLADTPEPTPGQCRFAERILSEYVRNVKVRHQQA